MGGEGSALLIVGRMPTKSPTIAEMTLRRLPRPARQKARLRGSRRLAGLSGLIALSAGSSSQADIYKHVDKDGVITFSNRPGARGTLYAKARRPKAVVPFMPSDTSPLRHTRYDVHIRQAAVLYQIPEELVRAVIKVESDYDPRAVSTANAKGLMQLLPETADRMMVTDIFDPRQNIFGGVRYLRVLANLFNGNLQLTIAAYNAGETSVIRYGGIPPFEETEDYVEKVLAYYRHYRAASVRTRRR